MHLPVSCRGPAALCEQLGLGLVQDLGAVNDPLRKHRRALRGLALSDRPVIDPAGAFFSHISVGQAVGLIAQRVTQRDEVIAAFAHDVEQFANVVGLELVAVQQQDLFWFITDGLFRELLGVGEDLVAVGEITLA